MSNTRVWCSPLTKNIYAGSGRRTGDQTNVTSDALGAIIERVGAGNTITVRQNGEPAFEIEVRDIRKKEGER